MEFLKALYTFLYESILTVLEWFPWQLSIVMTNVNRPATAVRSGAAEMFRVLYLGLVRLPLLLFNVWLRRYWLSFADVCFGLRNSGAERQRAQPCTRATLPTPPCRPRSPLLTGKLGLLTCGPGPRPHN